MATGTDPLRREQIGVIAQEPGARIQAPTTNAALQLAESLRGATPEASRLMQGIAADRAEKARAQAAKDALENSGAQLADAVREGKLRPTQNPWYVQAYNTESAAIRAQKDLSALQTEALTWDTRDDPAAFDKQWRERLAEVSQGYEGKDTYAGFQPVANQFTQQVLATNQAQNAQRIEMERKQNVGALSTDALLTTLRAKGGTITPNEAFTTLLPARQQWFATGGNEEQWNQMVVDAVTAAAYSAQDPHLLDLLKAPELRFGPTSEAGSSLIGSGAKETPSQPYAPPSVTQEPGTDVLKIDLPKVSGFSFKPVDAAPGSRFGTRSAPTPTASTYHKGVDFPVPAGTPVKAPAPGRVIFVGKAEKGGGNVVRVDHGNGVVSAYAHLGSFKVKEGEVINAGQILAASGSSGDSTGPHLHWAVKVNGKAVNPLTFSGELGGTVEGPASGLGTGMEKLSGFPGQDQPFTVGQEPPANHIASGPSIYNMPGVADKVESDRYRISQAAEDAPLRQLRVLTNQRRAKAAEALDGLYETYGTDLLTGNYDRDTLIRELNGKGYSAPVIAMVFNDLRSQVTDSAGVQEARIAARSGSSQTALQVLNLGLKGVKDGYSEAYEQEVADAVLSGLITPAQGSSYVEGALGRTRQQASEAKADRAEARADARMNAKGAVDTAAELLQEASNLTALIAEKARLHPVLSKDRRFQNADWQKSQTQQIANRMRAWLAQHPGDYDGALAVGRNATAELIQGYVSKAPKSAGQGGPSAANSSSSNPRG